MLPGSLRHLATCCHLAGAVSASSLGRPFVPSMAGRGTPTHHLPRPRGLVGPPARGPGTRAKMSTR
eukprot:4449332-Alexandrium_andersonii.AAC.1